MTQTLLMVGTRKGLWIGTSDQARTSWQWTGPHFPMEEVYSVMIDRRGSSPRLLAGCSSSWFGPQVRRSDDLGATWQETPNGAIRFPEDAQLPDGSPATLARIWQLTPGVEEDVVWAGTEPGAVFRSEDRGESFTLVRGLWDHPHRAEWDAGFGGQAFHTILPHPDDPAAVLAALSTGGVYRTNDGGTSWAPANHGIKAEFYPGERNFPEFGQCVHKVARDPEDPDRLFLQNHGGVYRSDDGGDTWQDIAPGLPSEFGFAMVTHPHRANTAYTFPIADAGARWPVDGRARVCRTTDGGRTWEPLGDGALPDSFFAAVMRDGMCVDDHEEAGIYFGSRNGAVWSSPDAGATWAEIQRNLPDVMVVRAASLS
ncbi:WD40/YVTN/BNR-like repeat-containing protein [Nocardioides piscis]|uniref:Exo-alpha-sialidase n=1 Tax=Nocardioides piscis TaxID=2714938 RepID=A0A6G7YJY2_9ACTN|nr:exo-alpha-sialidase [Nocardioides piscis]QIK77054.1 exo-alpha-sialidase [Nocardioides piscis]